MNPASSSQREQRLVEQALARHAHVLGVREHGVDHLLRIAARGAAPRPPCAGWPVSRSGIALVVEVVHEAGDAPRSPRPRRSCRAYARTAVSTASMCLRSESDSVHSQTSSQASSRVGIARQSSRARVLHRGSRVLRVRTAARVPPAGPNGHMSDERRGVPVDRHSDRSPCRSAGVRAVPRPRAAGDRRPDRRDPGAAGRNPDRRLRARQAMVLTRRRLSAAFSAAPTPSRPLSRQSVPP